MINITYPIVIKGKEYDVHCLVKASKFYLTCGYCHGLEHISLKPESYQESYPLTTLTEWIEDFVTRHHHNTQPVIEPMV